MAKERIPLTDKEERILVQAQLMGLSTQSMVKIGNRLKALEEEKKDLDYIATAIHGYTWDDKDSPARLKVTNKDGYEITATHTGKKNSTWLSHSWEYNFVIEKPGTRFKTVKVGGDLFFDPSWKKKRMPAQNKYIFSLIRWANINLHKHVKSK